MCNCFYFLYFVFYVFNFIVVLHPMNGQYQRVSGNAVNAPDPNIVFNAPEALGEDRPALPGQDTARSQLLDAFGSDSDDNESEGVLEDWQDDRNVGGDEEESGTQGFADVGGPNSELSQGGSSLRTHSQGGPSLATYSRPFHTPFGSSIRNFLGMGRKVRRVPASNNDGVFANIVAKPLAGDKPSEDSPPTYAEAAADNAPPYWETTIMAPGLSDELFIEGLPVGSPINFAWNFMVSAAFQFVGFFLTYLLHTSHAAKHGSRAGLGFTLLQCGYYLRPDPVLSEPTEGPPKEYEPSNPNDYDVSGQDSLDTLGTSSFSQGHVAASVPSVGDDNSGATGWIATLLMVIGVVIILKAVGDYMQARRMEMAILHSQNSESESEEPAEVIAAARSEEMV